jgi:hypothetical protein
VAAVVARKIGADSASGLLGADEREVCSLEQFGDLASVGGKDHHSNAYIQLKGHPGVVERSTQPFKHALGLIVHHAWIDGVEKDQKSVRSNMTYAVWPALMRCETPCHFGQHLVAGRMTERSDDALELLNLNQADSYGPILQLRLDQ